MTGTWLVLHWGKDGDLTWKPILTSRNRVLNGPDVETGFRPISQNRLISRSRVSAHFSKSGGFSKSEVDIETISDFSESGFDSFLEIGWLLEIEFRLISRNHFPILLWRPIVASQNRKLTLRPFLTPRNRVSTNFSESADFAKSSFGFDSRNSTKSLSNQVEIRNRTFVHLIDFRLVCRFPEVINVSTTISSTFDLLWNVSRPCQNLSNYWKDLWIVVISVSD